MKSTILIARIMRVIETEGMLGEGSALAEAYADAVRKVNARLESVQAAVDAKQVSDAVRMMEDSPRLLDEINALDFNRLPDWEALCERQGWEHPVPFDRALIERVLMLNRSTEVAEPFLRMYRKAVRTNNNVLAVKALRRLSEVDHSQDWSDNLVQAEGALQRTLLDDFRAAQERVDEAEMLRIAQELLETPWQKEPTKHGIEEVRAFTAAQEKRRRDVEGGENIELLRKCHDGEWNRALAFSMLQALDSLVEKGWCVPDAERRMIDDCRRRCAEEMDAEERERRWKECCERLHGAVQHEDTAEIRDALAATEFMDHEPPEDLLRDAQQVILHEEAAKRRKVMQIGVCALLALVAVLGVSGWWLRKKLFNDRCEAEAVKLADLAQGAHAVDRLGEALNRLKSNDPEVYDDPRVNVYAGKLKTMFEANLARTNEIVEILAALSSRCDALWTNVNESVTGQFARAESLMTNEDAAYRASWRKLKASWNDHQEELAAAKRREAEERRTKVISAANVVCNRLKQEIGGETLNEAIVKCRTALSEWKADYGALLPEQESALVEVEKELAEAEQGQRNVCSAIDTLKTAESAPEAIVARKVLLEHYSGYAAIARLKPYPFEENEVREVLEGMSAEQKAFDATLSTGIDAAAFKTFLEENVTSLKEIPSFYSLIGLMYDGDQARKFFAVAKGRPEIKQTSYDKRWQINGEVFDFSRREMVSQSSCMRKPMRVPMEPTEEIKELVDAAGQSGMNVGKFENVLLKMIGKHLAAARKNDFVITEERFESWEQLCQGRYPAYRRIQLLDIYLKWLEEDLHLMPPDAVLKSWVKKVADLANPISVEGASEDLAWVCQWEPRIRRRNTECARLLAQFPKDWIDTYQTWRSARYSFREISDWKVETAGQILFDPRNAILAKSPDAVIPIVKKGTACDHPLYVLRQVNGAVELRPALVPSGGRWARTAAMGNGYIPGEPLFQVCRDGKPIDAMVKIQDIISKMPKNIAAQMVKKIPFFNVEVK